MTLRPHIQDFIDEQFNHIDYRKQSLLHWATLPPDWQDALQQHLRRYGQQCSAAVKRQAPIILLQRFAKVPLAELNAKHVADYLALTHVEGLDGSTRERFEHTRDDEIGHFLAFLTDVVGDRGEPNPEAVAMQWITGGALPTLKRKTGRKPRVIMSEAMRQRAITTLHQMPYTEPYVRAMHEFRMRAVLRGGKRGVNYDRLAWPHPEDEDGSLRAHGGTASKFRTDYTPDAHEALLLEEIRKGSPFTKPGQLVIHDYVAAERGQMMPLSNSTKLELFGNVRFLAGIPDQFSMDDRAIRHRILTTAWANGATTDELRAIGNHAVNSNVVEDFYLEPLEVAEASKFTDRVLGASKDLVCERCMLSLMPYHKACPRKSCGEPISKPQGSKDASLDAYVDAIELLGAA